MDLKTVVINTLFCDRAKTERGGMRHRTRWKKGKRMLDKKVNCRIKTKLIELLNQVQRNSSINHEDNVKVQILNTSTIQRLQSKIATTVNSSERPLSPSACSTIYHNP